MCDVSSDKLFNGRISPPGAFKSFGNNGMYVVPTRRPNAGFVYQFASGPIGAELTGP